MVPARDTDRHRALHFSENFKLVISPTGGSRGPAITSSGPPVETTVDPGVLAVNTV